MKTKIQKYVEEIQSVNITNAQELEAFRIQYAGKKGILNTLYEEFKQVEVVLKREIGQELNHLKSIVQDKISLCQENFSDQNAENKDFIDLSCPDSSTPLGSRHPISIMTHEIVTIFSRIGFVVAQGPEIEDDWHNFSALNFPPEHPARDMQDTFFIEKKEGHNDIALRTHTSSVQVRMMESNKPPIRAIFPGRVYRNEAISARSHCFFHQVEGLYIDKNVSYADLRETLLFYAKEMFGEETKIRLRPSFFPFTEPSAEMDIACKLCGGEGCSFCKHTGWVEVLGCGMIDPNVLRECGIDPEIYSGYAFGMGVERTTNLKYKVKDLRLFSENDLRFLKQFTGSELL